MIKCYVRGNKNRIKKFKSSLENEGYKIVEERVPEAAMHGATNYTVGYVLDAKFLDFDLVLVCYDAEITVYVGGHVFCKPMHSRKGFWKTEIVDKDLAF